MNVYNGTPHAIILCDPTTGAQLQEFPSNGMIRINESRAEKDLKIEGFPYPLVAPPTFHGLIGMPDDIDATLIVSMPVGQLIQACPNIWRGAVVGPDTGPDGVVRDAAGKIVGTKRFVVYKLHGLVQ